MSKFIVSARKYRPTTFEEVVGQAHVADTLKNALQTEKLAHSFLFCGPRGVGKTTCARILAKVINCQNPKDKTVPCDQCNSCLAFNDTASFNIIELDAASNNSVDNIRNLIDQVRVPPQQGKYKVFIIDEVHMLSTAAFNAFLKTLEEPPSYAIFILATTEKHKILPTILSRCQIFDFKRIQVKDVVIQLQNICEQEGLTAEPEALHLIGQKADGAMRDALSIFDKVASGSSTNITYKLVIQNLNILDYEYYFKVVDAFLMEDFSKVLLIMDDVVTQGFDVDQFIQGLASHMRDLLVCKDQRTVPLLDVSDSLKERYTSQAQYATRAMLLTGLDILNQCDIALPRATNKRLYAEIALSKINFAQRTIDAQFQIDGTAALEKKTKLVTDEPTSTPPTNYIISSQSEDNAKIQKQAAPKGTTSSLVQEEYATDKKSTDTADIDAPTFDIPSIEEVVEEPTASPSRQVVEETAQTTEVKKKAVKEQVAPPPVEIVDTPIQESVPKTTSNKPTAGIDLSLDSMMATLEAEDKALHAAKENFGMEGIKEIWADYTEHNPSPSVQSALNRALLKLQGEKILEITVPTALTGDMILNEGQLMDRIRNDLGVTSLSFEINVDAEAFPDFEEVKSTTNLKPREKYQLLLEKKPELSTLINKLELKPDNDVAL